MSQVNTKKSRQNTPSARSVAVRAVAEFLRSAPEYHAVELNTGTLDDRDARLAAAIYRATVQRWLTLEFLLNRLLRKKLEQSPPNLQAVLLTGAAQLLFMDKMPPHAVVNEAVKLAGKFGHASAEGLVNAVLRKVGDMKRQIAEPVAWKPSPHAVPWKDGQLRFEEAWLPPVKTLDRHLCIATSHPLALVRRMIEQFGSDEAVKLLHHTHVQSPTVVYCPSPPPPSADWAAHNESGSVLWQGEQQALSSFLQQVGGWVQDPASQRAVASTARLSSQLIADYCAGKGTKTKQLAAVHPQATVLAADTDATRSRILRETFADHPRVKVVAHDDFATYARKVDLLLLDVPCSNTGVLARRVEARYRFSTQAIAALSELQRGIFHRSVPLLKAGGLLLYSTCSLDKSENEGQARHACKEYGMTLLQEKSLLPSGCDASYHDGSYFALLRKLA